MVIDDQIIAGLSEPELKQVVIERLSESFDIRPEVKGTFLVDGSAVIIDFLLHPKPPLIEKGFVDEWIGLEVKQPADKTNKPIRCRDDHADQDWRSNHLRQILLAKPTG